MRRHQHPVFLEHPNAEVDHEHRKGQLERATGDNAGHDCAGEGTGEGGNCQLFEECWAERIFR